jgi:hypothetical protein
MQVLKHPSLHAAASKGKLPHELEAAAAAAAKKEAAAAKAAAEAEALRGIPGADASWDQVEELMRKVRGDMASGNMDKWTENGMQRASLISQLHGSWAQQAVRTVEQKKILHNFLVDFRVACNM